MEVSIEVHSLELVGYLMQSFARTHNNATINPTSQEKKESMSPNVRYLNSYSCQLRCREGRQSASKWANCCANTRHNYNIIQAHTRAVMANTHLQQHEIRNMWYSYQLVNIFNTPFLQHWFTFQDYWALIIIITKKTAGNRAVKHHARIGPYLTTTHITFKSMSVHNTIQYIASDRLFSFLKERVQTFNSNMQFSWKSE